MFETFNDKLLMEMQSYLTPVLNGKTEIKSHRNILQKKKMTPGFFLLIFAEVGREKDCRNMFTLSTSRKVLQIHTPFEK